MVKQLLPNQHVPLHFLYGKDDCCLCEHESEVTMLRELVRRLVVEVGLHDGCFMTAEGEAAYEEGLEELKKEGK